jgi:MFS family permease
VSTPAVDQDPLVRVRRGRALAGLCLTQVVGWGVLYYAFPVALAAIAADTGWSETGATKAFSTGLLVSAVAGIPVGRLLDRHGPRPVMTGGSVVAVPALIVIGLAPNPAVFLAGWIVAGLAMAAVFYPAAFAALTRWYGPDRVRALTILTLAGGLASTVFACRGTEARTAVRSGTQELLDDR